MTPAEARAALRRSPLEALLLHRCERAGLPLPQTQVALIPGRRWRYDAVWAAERVAVEVQGSTWTQGRHTRGRGYRNDAEKRAAAQLAGYLVLDVTADMLRDGSAVALIAAALRLTGED